MATSLAKQIENLKLANSMSYEGNELRMIGILSKSREEWCVTDIACWMTSVTSVPLYDTLGEESICVIFEQTELSTLFLPFVSIAKLLGIQKKGLLPSLKRLVCFDEIDPATYSNAKDLGIEILSFASLVKKGETLTVELKHCKPNDMMTICYTSGTTARCKGVEILHQAFHDNAQSALTSGVLEEYFPGMTYLSFLPLAHVFERVMHYVCIIGAFKVGYYSGDVMKIKDDIATLQPHLFAGVPRIYARFYEAIMGQIDKATGVKRTLLKMAIETKTDAFKNKHVFSNWFYDKFVLSKIRNALGGRITTMVSSAAPLDANIIMMFQILFSVAFIQGYGQTEAGGAITLSLPGETDRASLGPPMTCNQAKIQDVPEMNYLSTDMMDGVNIPRGELCVKGTNITRGYFKDPEKTKETIDSNGWMHTGDIVMVATNGTLKIIDRKKNIFKLQQGEYVAPEKIENILVNCKWLAQVFVYGDSLQTYLIAIVIPKVDVAMKWAKEKGKYLIV